MVAIDAFLSKKFFYFRSQIQPKDLCYFLTQSDALLFEQEAEVVSEMDPEDATVLKIRQKTKLPELKKKKRKTNKNEVIEIFE